MACNDLSDKNVVIFFGSQTGTAEEFAQRIAKDGRKFGLNALVADLQDYDMVARFTHYRIFQLRPSILLHVFGVLMHDGIYFENEKC
jgi:sulfite reductase alpha subunit-like flavoprotein